MAENNEVDIEVSDDDNLESTSSNRGSKTAPHFTLLVDGNYRCKKCKESRPSKEVIIKKDKTGSTCGRWRHLKKVHPGIFRTLRPIKGQPSVADIYKKTDEQEAQFVDINFDSLKEAICKLICRMDLPFTSSEHPAFKEYSDFLARQNLSLPAARTIRETALKKFDEGKEILRNRLDPIRLVSLTIDSWTSENQVAILGITIHWIDEDWNLCERVLATEELKGEHSGENMANMVHDVLKDYNLTKKLCAITTDNASNNGTMAAELENLLGSPGIIFNKECHMPCMGHIINLAVQEGLKNLDVQGTPAKEAHDEFFHPFQVTARDTLGCLLLRVRELVKAAKRNPQRIAYYKVICKEKNQNENMLQLDVPTRWNSTHEMIDIAWQKREVLTKMVKDLMFISKHNLSIMDDEWHILKIFSDGLKLFQDSTKLLSTSKRVSASTALSVLDALISELDSQFSNITKIAGRGLNMQQAVALKNTYMAMKGKLLKYSNILQKKPSFAIAALLDPQYKLSFISSENTSFVCSSLLKYFEKVMDASISQHKTTIGGSEANEDVSPSSQDGSLKRAECDNSILETIKRRRPIIKEVEKTGKEELDEFLRGPYTNNCALDWWRSTGSQRYPCLAVLAKGFLAIPATSTPAERLFSTGRGIVTYKRGKLNAESITTLMTLKCWIKEDCHDLANLEASVDDVDAQLRVP